MGWELVRGGVRWISAQDLAELAARAAKPGLHVVLRDAYHAGHLLRRQPFQLAQEYDFPVGAGQRPKRASQLPAQRGGVRELLGSPGESWQRVVERRNPRGFAGPLAAADKACVPHGPVEPRPESLGVADPSHVAVRPDQRFLHRVFCITGVQEALIRTYRNVGRIRDPE